MTDSVTIEHLSKTFPGTKALDDVSFSIAAAGIHALVGGNGSGKSTVIKILAGVYQGDPGGNIDILGLRVPSQATSPTLARAQGLRFVHQNPGLFQNLTVADNIAIASRFPTFMGRVRKGALRARAQRLLDRFELSVRPDDLLSELRPADQTMVAVARALEEDAASAPTLLVLDEPTASLPEHEVNILLDALRRCASSGQSILYVSHRLGEVLDIADALTVLRDGREVVTRGTEGVTEAQLAEYIVGRPLGRVFASSDAPHVGAVALKVTGLRGGPLQDVSLTVHAGEIVGIAGLLASGRTELLQMIFGALGRDEGMIELGGQPLNTKTPAGAMRRGVAYVPENREKDAAFSPLTVRENLSAGQVLKYRTLRGLDARRERLDARESITRFSIRAFAESQVFSTLSGGNQQKVVLARWLRRDPLVLLLDEPTQGVDIGARADVYASIRRAVDGGMAVLLVSSDFEELVHAADRVLVLREGRITNELDAGNLDADTLTHLTYTPLTEVAAP